jgi:hypothetical protein
MPMFLVLHTDAESPKADSVRCTLEEVQATYPDLASLVAQPEFSRLDLVVGTSAITIEVEE